VLLDEAHTASRFPDVAWLLGACCSPQVIVLQNEGGATYRAAPDNFSINSLTSLATLDVDRLANKNQARLAKLHALQGECVGSDFSPTVTRNVLTSLVANLCEKFTGNPAIKPQAAASTYFSFDMKLVRLGKVVRHSLRQLVKVQLLDCRRRVRASFPFLFSNVLQMFRLTISFGMSVLIYCLFASSTNVHLCEVGILRTLIWYVACPG